MYRRCTTRWPAPLWLPHTPLASRDRRAPVTVVVSEHESPSGHTGGALTLRVLGGGCSAAPGATRADHQEQEPSCPRRRLETQTQSRETRWSLVTRCDCVSHREQLRAVRVNNSPRKTDT